MVDLGGYVIILVETKDKKIKLYGKQTTRERVLDAVASRSFYNDYFAFFRFSSW